MDKQRERAHYVFNIRKRENEVAIKRHQSMIKQNNQEVVKDKKIV